MGNSHCVPQAPRRLRASFSRKPSLKGAREDGARRLAGLLGAADAGPDGDCPADKIFYYIPGADLPGPESQPESPEPPLLGVFRKGRRHVPIRNLGQVLHYAKVQLRLLHSQAASDCYLELFPAHLYFQAHGAEGLTFQGLLPLAELSVRPLDGPEPGFQVSGPPPAPLLVLCPGPAEARRWLFHLDKQVAAARGLQRCRSAPPQGAPEDALPWTLQRRLTRLPSAAGRPAAGGAICASRVRLQHLPAEEQWERLLVLYPTTLAIFSEDADGLRFKGELPLSAVRLNLEERDKRIRSFLIEGPLINTIRVLCASYEDYSRWLLCLQAAARALCSPAERYPVVDGSWSSLSSDARASWGPGCPPPPSARTSRSLPESSPAPAPDQDGPGCPSIGRRRPEPRRGSGRRPPGGRTRGQDPAPPLHLDLTELGPAAGPEAPAGPPDSPRSPLYADPYTPPATAHRRVKDAPSLDELLEAVKPSPEPQPVPEPRPAAPGPRPPSRKAAPQPPASRGHPGFVEGGGPPPQGSPQLASPAKEGSPLPRPPGSDGRTPGSNEALPPAPPRWSRPCPPPAEAGLVHWI